MLFFDIKIIFPDNEGKTGAAWKRGGVGGKGGGWGHRGEMTQTVYAHVNK
jgi:hypothetical protein